MAEILATGTTAANSADFTLSGETSSLLLKWAAAPLDNSAVDVMVKDAGGLYNRIGQLTTITPMVALIAPGTFRVSRPANSPACGVDRA